MEISLPEITFNPLDYCYIIFSKKLNRFYIGICHDNLQQRILKHNNHTYGAHRFTSKANDWELFISIKCESASVARKLELHIKKMKSSVYIKNLKKYPELVDKLLNQYK